jgi:hypothetical protein
MNTDLAKAKIVSLWSYLVKHRAKIAAGVTAAAFLTLMFRNARQIESFMADHNLTDEYNNWLTGEE